MPLAEKPIVRNRVSLVVACYNHAPYVARRMESLLAQTHPDVEIIVLDDCSQDNTADILRAYAGDPRVTLIRRPVNGGWVTTFNEGLKRCTGEFILFANGDDECDSRLLERLVHALSVHPGAGIAFCRSQFVDDDGRLLSEDFDYRERSFRSRCAADTCLSGAEMSRFLLHSCVIPNMSAALIRRDCFASLGSFTQDYPVCGDWEFFFRVAARYDYAYVAEALNRFRQHATTVRRSTRARVTLGEYLRLLLTQARVLDLTVRQRRQARERAMDLWAAHLVAPSLAGLSDAVFHFRLVWQRDPAALPWLLSSLARRCGDIVVKAVRGRARPLVGAADRLHGG